MIQRTVVLATEMGEDRRWSAQLSFGDEEIWFAGNMDGRASEGGDSSTFTYSLNSLDMNMTSGDNSIVGDGTSAIVGNEIGDHGEHLSENESPKKGGVMSVVEGVYALNSPFASPFVSDSDVPSWKNWICRFREIDKILIMMTPLAGQREELMVRFQVEELDHFDLYRSYLKINCKEGTFRCDEDSRTIVFGDEMFLVAIHIARASFHRDGIVLGMFDLELLKLLFGQFIFMDKG